MKSNVLLLAASFVLVASAYAVVEKSNIETTVGRTFVSLYCLKIQQPVTTWFWQVSDDVQKRVLELRIKNLWQMSQV